MKFRPIMMSDENVRSILDGRKTQTRRLMKEAPGSGVTARCRFGAPGDGLWVREAYREFWSASIYRADFADGSQGPWKPSIFMPRAASRIELEITGTRSERLLDISREDAIAEGIERAKWAELSGGRQLWNVYGAGGTTVDPRHSYLTMWDSIHGDGAHALNRWVWVIEFRRVKP